MPAQQLTREEYFFADTLFRLRIYECDGQAYEDLFVSVFEKCRPGFKAIKPHGKAGDRKNDGYVVQTGSYYQVYAPEDASHKVSEAIKKAKVDFAGLKAFWESISPIKEYRFVLNDKFNGPYPDIERTLSEISSEHALSACECVLAKDLLKEFMLLDERSMMQIVGLLPNPSNLRNLDFSIFGDVIRHVINNSVSLNVTALLRVPDFDEKIRFNNISPAVGALLTKGGYQTGAVSAFFQKNASVSKTAIRNKLADIYSYHRNHLAEITMSGIQKGDAIFFAILKDIVPSAQPAAQDAALALMAHFFESCDIYEDPNLLT